MLLGMSDDPIGTKPQPLPKPGSVISLADRDQERRHEAARRLAERHNAALRPPLRRHRLRACTHKLDIGRLSALRVNRTRGYDGNDVNDQSGHQCCYYRDGLPKQLARVMPHTRAARTC